MNRPKLFLAFVLSWGVAACSSAPTGPGGGPTGGNADGGASNTDDGASSTSSVPSADICSFLLAPNCPGVENTPAHETTCEQAYDVAATRGCKTFIDQGWACLATKDSSALTCAGGDEYVTDPTCQQPGTVMIKCVGAVNDPACYGGACSSFTDCPSGWSCNTAIGQCYDDAHACLGLPCDSFTDCSAGTTCNSALKVCTKN